jgi:hypothetical protein
MWRAVRAISPAAVLTLVACAGEPIAWGEREYLAAGGSSGEIVIAHAGFCVAAEARLGVFRWRAGWRAAAGELLVAMSSDSGATWNAPVIADERDSSGRACERRPPSVFADSSNGFLHIAYFSEAPGAPGVYYVHSMAAERLEQRGAGMFEQPRAITYGARAARTSVVSRGDTVIVAYEDPNSARGPIQLAISTTAGHSFERYTRVPGSAGGVLPVVELQPGGVIVAWREATEAARVLRRRGSFR